MSDKTVALPTETGGPNCLPVRFRRDPADLSGCDLERGRLRAKQSRAYYLDGLTAVFQPDVSLPGRLDVDQKFSGSEVALLYPGSSAVEVLGIINRFPDIKCLHLIESSEANLDTIRCELQKEIGRRWLPELAGYVTDLRNLPAELSRRCELAVEIDVVDPKADKLFRQDAAQQISRILKLGGLFYSAGVTVRWTDGIFPLSLVRVAIRGKLLKQVGYSEALPQPVFYLKRSPDDSSVPSVTGCWQRWRKLGMAFIGQGRTKTEDAVETAFVPRVEDGRGEPNPAPWNFLITKPSIRRPAMEWTPKTSDRFGNLTLGSLLQHNRQTGMFVFRMLDCPEVVLKIMKPFEGDIPDDPLEWASLRKSKTLKRENQALKLLKGLDFIPQRIAHGYDPATGWYAIVVECETSRSFSSFIDQRCNQLHRRHETPDDVESALEPVLMLLNSLAIIHDKGLVHQDLKPAHVFLRPASSEAVLIDWGLARMVDEPLSEERRSCSWVHAPPERSDVNVLATAGTQQDLYAVGVMLLQLASDLNFDERPRFLVDYFCHHGRMPSAVELESRLRPHWQWAAPIIAQAISSRRDIPGYADNRFTNARDMAREITRRYEKTAAGIPFT